VLVTHDAPVAAAGRIIRLVDGRIVDDRPSARAEDGGAGRAVPT
jgi:hypothetical protein